MKTNNLATKFTEIESLIQSLSHADGNTPLKEVQPQLAQVKRLINEARALQTSELEFSHLLSYVPEVCAESVVITDTNGNIQWVNPAFSKITGYSAEEVIGKNPRLLKSGQQDQAFYNKLWDTIKAGKIWSSEIINQAKDGHLINCEMVITPTLNAQGAVTHFIAVEQNVTRYKQIEQALRESEAYRRSITKNSPDQIISLDPELNIQFINHTAPGLTIEQVTGTPICNYFAEDAEVKAKLESVLATGQPIRYDTEYVTPAKDIIYYESHATPRIVSGQIVGIVIIARDMTDRKMAESALQQSNAKIELLLNSTAEGIFGIDLEGQCIFCNSACVKLLGYNSVEYLLGHDMHNLIHHSYKDGSPYPLEKCKIYQSFRNGEGTQHDDEVLWRADGTCFPVEYWYYPVFQEGKISGSVVTFIDITERKQAEQKLAQFNQELEEKVQQSTEELQATNEELQAANEELQIRNEEVQYAAKELQASRAGFRSVVDKNASGIMVVDEKGIIQYINPAMQSQFHDYNLAVGNEFALTHPGKRTEVKIALSEDEIGTAEMDAVETLWEDKPAHLIMLHDITETKKAHVTLEEERTSLAQRVKERTAELSLANAELARAARLKDEFLANMSHELRTPLNAILSMSELLTDGIYGEINKEQLKAVRHIDKGGRHLLSLITDILDLSKIAAGKMKLETAAVIIDSVCLSCIQMVKQIGMKKRVSVLFASDDKVKTLFADERAVKQILVNLLYNAVKFTPHKGKVILELLGDEINRVANINVIDTGIGIPEHELDNLFKPFVQIDSRLNRLHEGTGLGLALVYKLVELHGGSVRVKSEEGKGSTFTVSLPWQESDKILSIREDDYVITQKDINVRHADAVVLVAEDNEINIVAIQSGLTRYGYNVIVTRNGGEAIDRAHEIKPAIILMDIQMPGMDGLEATQKIRADTDEQLAKTPIIALTALAMPGDKKRCLDAGVNVYLTKPVKMKQLVAEIERLLL
jgi:PAS domain S-box-containing protein